MAEAELPGDVKAFIDRHLITGAQADVLVLLCRERRPWTAGAVGRELRIDVDQASFLLGHLEQSGLLVRNGDGDAYACRPGDSGPESVVGRFCRLYPVFRVAVISLIFSRERL